MDATQLGSAFERDGYVSGLRVRGGAEADATRRQFDLLEEREGREKCQIGLVDRHFDERFVWDLATDPTILDAVEAAMGPDVMLLATHFFCKYPSGEGVGRWALGVGTGQGSDRPDAQKQPQNATAPTPNAQRPTPSPRFVAWHQDVTYWGLEPAYALTAWYAVDDSDCENGAMRVIPGTHGSIREHGTSQKAGNLLSINQEVPVTEDEEQRAVDLVLRAGEISLHHGMLIHGSNPNSSSRRRCGLTIRYIPPHVRVVEANSMRRPWKATLLRGTDRYGHFEPLDFPFPLRERAAAG